MGYMTSAVSTTAKNADERRAARLAALRERRSTPEFTDAGAALRARQAAEVEAARQARAARLDDAVMRLALSANPTAVDRHLAAFEEIAAEHDDTAALDLLDSYITAEVLTGRSDRRKIAVALELLRTQFAIVGTDAWNHLRRITAS